MHTKYIDLFSAIAFTIGLGIATVYLLTQGWWALLGVAFGYWWFKCAQELQQRYEELKEWEWERDHDAR